MTCIVGLVDNDIIYIGGDSAGVGGLEISIRTDEKVFITGPFIMGFTSSFRMGQLLRYKLTVAKQTTDQNDTQYLVTTFIDAVRECFTANGFGTASAGGRFLVGYNGVLYTIDSDFQVGKVIQQYDACGCGRDLALGALYATHGKKPIDRIKTALNAAAAFSAGVAPPFVILKQIKKAQKSK